MFLNGTLNFSHKVIFIIAIFMPIYYMGVRGHVSRCMTIFTRFTQNRSLLHGSNMHEAMYTVILSPDLSKLRISMHCTVIPSCF